MTRLVIAAEQAGARVDRVVADGCGVAMAVARRLCGDGLVRGAHGRLAAGDRVGIGDVVDIDQRPWLEPVDRPLSILWQDDAVVVVDKPAGLACHPLDPGEVDSVVHRLVGAFPEIASASPSPREGGLVHRLDTDTSGCLAIARTRPAWETLRAAIDGATKTYLAVVAGDARALDGVVLDAPIGHDAADRRRMVTAPDGAPCQTAVAVVGLGRLEGVPLTLVRLELQGGRRHQLRVHLASQGHPLLGDGLYGGSVAGAATSTMLHAWRLVLPGHAPVTAPLPRAFQAVLEGAGIPSGF